MSPFESALRCLERVAGERSAGAKTARGLTRLLAAGREEVRPDLGTLCSECARLLERGSSSRRVLGLVARELVADASPDGDRAYEELLARLTRDPLLEVWLPAARAAGAYSVRIGRPDWILAGGPGESMSGSFRRRIYPALAAAVGAGWDEGLRWLRQALRSRNEWDRSSALLAVEEFVPVREGLVLDFLDAALGDATVHLRGQVVGAILRILRLDPPPGTALQERLWEMAREIFSGAVVEPRNPSGYAMEVELREELAAVAGWFAAGGDDAAVELGRMADPARFGFWGALAARREMARLAPGSSSLVDLPVPDDVAGARRIASIASVNDGARGLPALLGFLGDPEIPPGAKVVAADSLSAAILDARESGAPEALPPGWPQLLAVGGGGDVAPAALEALQALVRVPCWIEEGARGARAALSGEGTEPYFGVRAFEDALAGGGREVERLLAVLRRGARGPVAAGFDDLTAQISRARGDAFLGWTEAVLETGNYWLIHRLFHQIHRTGDLNPQRALELVAESWDRIPQGLFSRRLPALLADLLGRVDEGARSSHRRRLRGLASGGEVLARIQAWSGEEVPPREELGERIGPYVLVGKIRAGGFAVVHRAVHPHLGIDVAVKIPRDEASPRFPGEVEAFFREARLLAQLSDRGGVRNVLRVYDAGVDRRGDSSRYYIVTELVEAGSLEDLLSERGGRLPPEEAAAIVRMACRGVEAAHRLRPPVIHRDLSPSNILLKDTPGGRLVLVCDFGAACVADPRSRGPFVGKLEYSAPEALQGGIAPALDIYGLGACLYRCLAGRPPHAGEGVTELLDSVLHVRPEPLQHVVPDVSPALAAVVEKAMDPDASARYPSALDMEEALALLVPGREDFQ